MDRIIRNMWMRSWIPQRAIKIAVGIAVVLTAAGCALFDQRAEAPVSESAEDYTYVIGPGDSVNIFVWRNPDLSSSAVVRPDGKFSTPLVDELVASGKTPPRARPRS